MDEESRTLEAVITSLQEQLRTTREELVNARAATARAEEALLNATTAEGSPTPSHSDDDDASFQAEQHRLYDNDGENDSTGDEPQQPPLEGDESGYPHDEDMREEEQQPEFGDEEEEARSHSAEHEDDDPAVVVGASGEFSEYAQYHEDEYGQGYDDGDGGEGEGHYSQEGENEEYASYHDEH